MTPTSIPGAPSRGATDPTAPPDSSAAGGRHTHASAGETADDDRDRVGQTADDRPRGPGRRGPTGIGDPRGRVLGGVAGAAVVVGSLGPWATIGPFTTSGTSGDGVITLLLAALALCAIGLGRLLPGVAIAGVLIALIGAYDALDIAGTGGPLDPSPGWGVLVTAAGGATLAVWAVRAMRGRSGDARDAPQMGVGPI